MTNAVITISVDNKKLTGLVSYWFALHLYGLLTG